MGTAGTGGGGRGGCGILAQPDFIVSTGFVSAVRRMPRNVRGRGQAQRGQPRGISRCWRAEHGHAQGTQQQDGTQRTPARRSGRGRSSARGQERHRIALHKPTSGRRPEECSLPALTRTRQTNRSQPRTERHIYGAAVAPPLCPCVPDTPDSQHNTHSVYVKWQQPRSAGTRGTWRRRQSRYAQQHDARPGDTRARRAAGAGALCQ